MTNGCWADCDQTLSRLSSPSEIQRARKATVEMASPAGIVAVVAVVAVTLGEASVVAAGVTVAGAGGVPASTAGTRPSTCVNWTRSGGEAGTTFLAATPPTGPVPSAGSRDTVGGASGVRPGAAGT